MTHLFPSRRSSDLGPAPPWGGERLHLWLERHRARHLSFLAWARRRWPQKGEDHPAPPRSRLFSPYPPPPAPARPSREQGRQEEARQVAQRQGHSYDPLVQIGRAHVCTPVTNAHLVCSILLETQKTNKLEMN